MQTYIIKNQKDLNKFKDDYGYKIDGNAEFEYSAIFEGRLLVNGYLSIKAGESIKAGGSIKAGEFIEAGGSIEAGDNYGISAVLSITCKGKLKFGLKAFAGICTWKNISDQEKTITCGKFEGGVIEYGVLIETGLPEEKMITLSNGKKVSESTIIEALKGLVK